MSETRKQKVAVTASKGGGVFSGGVEQGQVVEVPAWKFIRVQRIPDLRKPGDRAVVTIRGLGGELSVEESFDEIVDRLHALGVTPDIIK
jgi:hypothetical protein